MLEAMVKAGIKTADDLNRVHGIASRVGELGVDLDQLTASFQGRTRQTPAAGDDGGDDEGVDIEAVVDRRLATRDHATAEAVEKRLIASTINTLAGEGASDRTKKAIAGIVGELVNDRSTLYPKGHPLAGQLRPLGDNEMAEIRAEAETIWKEARGVPLSSVAAGAATARPVAGSAAGQGPAADKQNTTHLPAYKRPMEDRRAQVRQIVQGLGTGGSAPMSRA